MLVAIAGGLLLLCLAASFGIGYLQSRSQDPLRSRRMHLAWATIGTAEIALLLAGMSAGLGAGYLIDDAVAARGGERQTLVTLLGGLMAGVGVGGWLVRKLEVRMIGYFVRLFEKRP